MQIFDARPLSVIFARLTLQARDAEQVAQGERHAAALAAYGVRLRTPRERHREGSAARLG